MKKKITGSVLSAGAIVLGLAAAGCGGAIENAANGWAMLGYTLLAIVLGCAALALAGLGDVAGDFGGAAEDPQGTGEHGEESRLRQKGGVRMVRIEIKKTVKGQMMLAVEAEHESLDEVLTCAARCFVGVARKLLGPISTDPLFADEAAKLIKDLLTDTEGFKVTEGYEGKEARFIAALNGMNAGKQK